MRSTNRDKNINYFKLLVFAMIVALLVRLLLIPFGNHWDVTVNTGWAKWMYLDGFRGFYENNNWYYVRPSQFPLINLIYMINYGIFLALSKLQQTLFGPNTSFWFNSFYQDTPYRIGEIIAMKIIPIVTDQVIALLIFYLGAKFSNQKMGLIGAVFYLFFPFSFYISSLWGQYDQLSALLLALSFLIFFVLRLNSNIKFALSSLLYFSAFEVKPTVIFTLPLYLYFLYQKKQKLSNLVIVPVVVFLLTLITTWPFANTFPISYLLRKIYPVVIDSDRYFTSTHTFNFWGLFTPTEVSSWYNEIFGIRYVSFGILVVFVVNVISISIYKKFNDIKGMLLALYITVAGGYLFATGMVERYFFGAVVILLFFSVLLKKIFPLWLITATIFTLNLYFSWGFPGNENLPRYFWLNHGAVQIFSLIQIILFFITIYFSVLSLSKSYK
jgi:Gpi18-like mannosyltransferase